MAKAAGGPPGVDRPKEPVGGPNAEPTTFLRSVGCPLGVGLRFPPLGRRVPSRCGFGRDPRGIPRQGTHTASSTTAVG